MPGRALEEQAAAVASLLPRIMGGLNRIDMEDPTTELSLAQIRVCTLLRGGARSVSALGRKLGITASAITQMADRLERAGLVERISEEEDRRVKCLRLTPRGEEAMRIRKARRLARVREVLAFMSPEEREELIGSLERLLAAIRAGSCEEDSPPEMEPGSETENL